MLIFGQAHKELDELLTHIRQEISMGEKILAANKARLVHFEQTLEALMGITDPASLPPAPDAATAAYTGPAAINALTGDAGQVGSAGSAAA